MSMRKNQTQLSSAQNRGLSSTRRTNFFAPFFDDELEPLRWFSDMFGRDLMPMSVFGDRKSFLPAIDVDESAEAFMVSADLPGVRKEDISIECADNQLTITAERKHEDSEPNQMSNDGKNISGSRRERFYGRYYRSMSLPIGVDSEKIEASFDNGVLTLRIPKTESTKSRRIEIRSDQGGFLKTQNQNRSRQEDNLEQ